MALARAFMRNPGGRALLVIGVFLLAFEIWIALTAPQKIDPAVLATAQAEGSANVVVELNFPPESYHFLFLQDYGRISGSSEEGVRLRRVSPETCGRWPGRTGSRTSNPWSSRPMERDSRTTSKRNDHSMEDEAWRNMTKA